MYYRMVVYLMLQCTKMMKHIPVYFLEILDVPTFSFPTCLVFPVPEVSGAVFPGKVQDWGGLVFINQNQKTKIL